MEWLLYIFCVERIYAFTFPCYNIFWLFNDCANCCIDPLDYWEGESLSRGRGHHWQLHSRTKEESRITRTPNRHFQGRPIRGSAQTGARQTVRTHIVICLLVAAFLPLSGVVVVAVIHYVRLELLTTTFTFHAEPLKQLLMITQLTNAFLRDVVRANRTSLWQTMW